MKVLINESLKKYTTIRIGGIAKKMYVPESAQELIELLQKNEQKFTFRRGRTS